MEPSTFAPMQPRLFKITKFQQELGDTFTMTIKPTDNQPAGFAPGQFNMLYAFGVGEAPISVSGDPSEQGVLVHTTRAVGKVTEALCSLRVGDTVGVRGPFGSVWPVEAMRGHDILFVSGGLGLAPLRPAIYHVLNNRSFYGNVGILYGSRRPEDILFKDELSLWRARFDLETQITVDRGSANWGGKIGVVTKLLGVDSFDYPRCVAFVCGPEIMMLNSMQTLLQRGVTANHIYFSMERSMKCGIKRCGRCQWGSAFVCKEGPVFRYDKVATDLKIWEL